MSLHRCPCAECERPVLFAYGSDLEDLQCEDCTLIVCATCWEKHKAGQCGRREDDFDEVEELRLEAEAARAAS